MIHPFGNAVALKFSVSIFCLSLFSSFIFSQSIDQKVHIEGRVYDNENTSLSYNVMVINKKTQQGFFGDEDGKFSLFVNKNDTIILGVVGYKTTQFSLKDSLYKPNYQVFIKIEKLRIELKQVEIFSKRELSEIQKDIEKLGFDKADYALSGIDALQSPITFLYQAFSRREQHKRQVAEWRNEDKKRELLKELLGKYVDGDIIQLENKDFDEFIDFASVSDEFIKGSSQYNFIMYIKKRFELFSLMKKG